MTGIGCPKRRAVLVAFGWCIAACTELNAGPDPVPPDGGLMTTTNPVLSPETPPAPDALAPVVMNPVATEPPQTTVPWTDGGMSADAPCATDGAMRCTAIAGQREQCMGGQWTQATPCDSGSLCTLSASGEDGTCAPVAEVCLGSPGRTVCDRSGTLVVCGSDGVPTSMMACNSVQHCELGAVRGTCAICLPGAADGYRCEGAELQRCADAGDQYEAVETCNTAALCNAVAGACTTSACTEGQTICDGDVLKSCNADRTGFDTVKTCEPGLCDANAGECDTCIAGTLDCLDSRVTRRCAIDGSAWINAACPADTPICVGLGKCVVCDSDDDCSTSADCRTPHCELATGVCAPQLALPGTDCSGGRQCNGSGECVKCYGRANEDGNACGGCASLSAAPDSSCSNGLLGDCQRTGKYVCSGPDTVTCDAPSVSPRAAQCGGGDEDCDGDTDEAGTRNACGGCASLSGTLGSACDGNDADQCRDGKLVCTSADRLACDDDGASASEVCDNTDNDCDGRVDEGVQTTWYRDADGDGYGVSSQTRTACNQPSGYVSRSGDCCDSEAQARPGATTWRTARNSCNSYDWNCSGTVELRYPSLQSETCSNANGCDATPGWQGSSVPTCGNTGNYLTSCSPNGAFCGGQVTGGQQQSCR